MTPEQYDQLLTDISAARLELEWARSQEQAAMGRLDHLLRKLDQEERRMAREALASTRSASRKLVVGE